MTGKFISKCEDHGLLVVAQKRIRLSRLHESQFYYVHKDRPFYDELVEYMVSGPVIVQVLEGENAVARNREIMGATDPAKSPAGTIRKEFGQDVGRNSVHGSDSLENAVNEIRYFFSEMEIVG